jgi:hypothetical protein
MAGGRTAHGGQPAAFAFVKVQPAKRIKAFFYQEIAFSAFKKSFTFVFHYTKLLNR